VLEFLLRILGYRVGQSLSLPLESIPPRTRFPVQGHVGPRRAHRKVTGEQPNHP
jgi:hypothetical protein